MSKDNCSSRPIQLLANENEFENPLNQIPLIPSRAPLNLIPDPSQCQSTTPQHDTKDKPPSSPHLISSLLKMPSSRAYDRGKSYNIEPYSAQSTPVRSARRLSNVGPGSGGYTSLVRLPGGGKFGLLPRVSRGISVAIPAKVSADVPRFELDEDPSFWNDHNVQVLIRIRPLNDVEMVSQGSGRCLRQESAQTVVWLGHPETRFTFDHIACESTSQEKLFKVVGLPMVDNCMSGYNSCMFTYGQTGSGKTYTMMGEIDKMDGKLSDDCGITPRIYEYLFTRITKEEESRKHERLTYSCKCSFLEIYNEHITDLLEPSSTNLQLREDLKKGVYVENLTEHSVRTVNDILKLLQQGAANRKIASTYMNSESSRSHSVFTCIIESRWEKDSMAHLRFGRLNLVDLAGSERQKSSGAEGDRLKEAANINKSLSTLGLVIMSLVDLAQGKQRHVPYRDSRLTFLLQDSLGGNSKTAIIANVSPSISSANETLSTLKFAQRAKLIQNNAKINEDASGDVIVLQQQIQQLKGQLSFLMKHQHDSTKVQDFTPSPDQSSFGYFIRRHESFEESNVYDEHEAPNEEFVKIKYFKATLTCAMRREKLAEMEVRRLKSEIELLNHLAHQREDESQHSKTMLRFREEKIKRLELLSEQLISADKFYLDENKALREENLLLQTKIDRNPEVMASENIRLLEQIRSYRNFYEQGETQTLVAEMSELRNQFLELLEVEKSHAGPRFFPMKGKQELEVSKALERCKYINSTLIREVDELMHQNANGMNWDNFTFNSRSDSVDEATSKHLQRGDAIYDKNDLQMEHILQFDNVHKQLMDAQSSIATMKVEHVQLVKELQSLQTENQRLLKNVGSKRISQSEVGNIHEDYDDQIDSGNQYASVNIQVNECTGMDKLQAKLDNLSCDLKGAEILNRQHTEDHTRRLSQDDKAELIRNEAELETAQTIIYLQEEIDRVQSEFQVHLCSLTEQNTSLRNNLAVKEDELRMFCAEWERAIMELTTFLIDGCRSLGDASCQIKSISSSFPNVNDWIGEHVEKAAKICLEKEETILLLQNSLEDAKKAVMQMQQKLFSLMGATIVLTEVQQMKISTCGEEFQFPKVSYDTHEVKEYAETRFISEKAQITENQDAAALLVEHRTPDCSMSTTSGNVEQSMLPAHRNAHGTTDVDGCIKLEISILSEIEDAVNRLCSDATALDSDIHCAVSVYRELVHNLLKDISDMRKDIADLKKNQGSLKLQIPQQIRNELVEINKRLTYMHACFYNIRSVHCHLDSAEGSTETEGWTTDFYSCSNSSVETLVNDEKSSSVINGCICKLTDGKEDLNCVEGSSMSCNIVFLHLMEEFRKAYGSFLKLRYHLMEFSVGETNQSRVDHIFSDICPLKSLKEQGPDRHDHPADQRIAGNNNLGELVVEEKCYPPTSFFDKFEESYATIKEADDVLKVMLKANETVNMLTAMWKHEGEELMADKASLGEQIKHLKSCILTGHEEKAVLQDEVQLSSKEIVILLTLLEGCFLKMQTGLEEVFETAHGNAVEDVKSLFCSLRSFLEDLMCKSIENDFSIFVLQCQMVEHFEKQRWEKSISTHAISTHHEDCLITGAPEQWHEGRNDNSAFPAVTCETDGDQFEYISTMKVEEMDLVLDESNSELVNQLKRKDILMKGLLFDFSLLQEFASHRKDIKDELEKLLVALSKVQHELQIKTVHLDDVLDHNMKLEGCLAEAEQALFNSNYELDQIKGKLNILSEHNVGLKDFLKDLYLKNSKAEQLLEEQKEAITNLEREIVRVSSSEKQKKRAVEDIEDTLIRVTAERDELVKTMTSLQDKFDLACALADENQAIAAEARQESEASKIFVEQKEEEVKILEHSIEELECTINVLEKKVSEMEDEVAKHRLTSDSLELELKELRHRLSTVEDFTESLTSENSNAEVTEDQLLRKLHGKCGEINEPRDQIRILQEENAKQSKEINQFKDYISELVLHAEAQASQYQQKYKNLEAMLNEVKTDLSSVSAQSTSERAEKISTRARGSSSPFKCIAGLIQQMNQEKDQELSISRHRIKELEALAASRHQEVCVLNTRMASAESMTHDVIRDLLSVKLDISNYANIIDQHQLQRLIEDAQHQRQEFVAMEREIFNLRSRIADLLEERERCIFEINKNKEQQLATQITVEQLRERNQLLVAQNDMLKMDKSNLQKRIVELDAMVKKLLKMQDMQPRNQLQTSSSLRSLDSDFGERLVDSQKMLSRINNQLAQYHQPGADTLNMRANGTKSRK